MGTWTSPQDKEERKPIGEAGAHDVERKGHDSTGGRAVIVNHHDHDHARAFQFGGWEERVNFYYYLLNSLERRKRVISKCLTIVLRIYIFKEDKK